MKTNSFLFLIAFISFSMLISSCGKDDNDDIIAEQPIDNVVGTWNVTEGEGTAYIDGYVYDDIEITTTGTIEFENDSTGLADFTMEIAGEVSTIDGTFDWYVDGFEIVWTNSDGDVIRWTRDMNEVNMQILTFTYKADETSNDEVEITLTLIRQ